MTILEYHRESPWAHKRRTRRMADELMPRSLERPIVLAAVITAIAAWLTLASWATAEIGQACSLARMTVAVEPGSTLTIRAEPSRDSRSRGALTAGTTVAVLEQRDGWALVDWPVMAESRATAEEGQARTERTAQGQGPLCEGAAQDCGEDSANGPKGRACGLTADGLQGRPGKQRGMGWVCMDYLKEVQEK